MLNDDEAQTLNVPVLNPQIKRLQQLVSEARQRVVARAHHHDPVAGARTLDERRAARCTVGIGEGLTAGGEASAMYGSPFQKSCAPVGGRGPLAA